MNPSLTGLRGCAGARLLPLLATLLLYSTPLLANHRVDPALKELEARMEEHAPFGPGFEFIELDRVYFGHDQTSLDARALKTLQKAAEYLLLNDNTIQRILIQGHTSDIAASAYNYRLSDQRAYRVRDYLLSHGVEDERMRVHSLGESAPADEPWSRQGRQNNRRVEIYVIRMP